DLGDELPIRGVVGQPLESVGADVYPRLVGKDHPGCEGRAIASDVVDVHSQPVAKAVHIPAAKLLSVFHGYEAETEKPVLDNAGRRCTYVGKGCAGLGRRRGGLLRVIDDLI